jgi:DNA polymerase-4
MVLPCEASVPSQAKLERFSYALLEPIFPVRLAIRLLGVTLSSIDRDEPKEERQLTLAL